MAAVQENVEKCGTGEYTREWFQEREQDSKDSIRAWLGVCASVITICVVAVAAVFCVEARNKGNNDSAHVIQMRRQADAQVRIAEAVEHKAGIVHVDPFGPNAASALYDKINLQITDIENSVRKRQSHTPR